MTNNAISHQQHLVLDRDHEKSAKAAHLCYMTDRQPGISRHPSPKGVAYTYHGKRVREKEQLDRIRRLAIPPSWTDVWISPTAESHLQATGHDLRGRKQYRYHAEWNSLRSDTKFHRMYEFGKALPAIRKRVKKDLAGRELTERKVLATILSLMEITAIRIGNSDYEKQNGSYGLTTLKDKHVAISKENIRFSFTGKKGVAHSISIRNARLARIVKQCRDVPGKELFQFYNDKGEKQSIDSGMVNNYIREAAENDFTAKDFRTWTGSLLALEYLGEFSLSETDSNKKVAEALDQVSAKLGNTRSICKKYYVHPRIIQLYEENKLRDVLHKYAIEAAKGGLHGLERIMLRIIRKGV